MILIAYDGSDDAKAAIASAATLFPGEAVTIATAWSHFVDTMARSGTTTGVLVDSEAVDAATKDTARDRVREGVAAAKEAGFGEASGVILAVTSTVAEAILEEATTQDVRAIVLGSRGLGTVKALFIGSVSDQVLHHADRPVIVVPSPEVAAHRSEHLKTSA